ncbi:MAG TPA: hypothetical protein VK009_02775 [Chloroflexota bacterium]|nr:hypothetical protein [Chloroflexota bacterium]
MSLRALVADLHSEDDGIRWSATEQLAQLGSSAVDAVLEELTHYPLGEKFRQSCLFIFEQQWNRATIARLREVVEALHGIDFRDQAPLAADRALHTHAS